MAPETWPLRDMRVLAHQRCEACDVVLSLKGASGRRHAVCAPRPAGHEEKRVSLHICRMLHIKDRHAMCLLAESLAPLLYTTSPHASTICHLNPTNNPTPASRCCAAPPRLSPRLQSWWRARRLRALATCGTRAVGWREVAWRAGGRLCGSLDGGGVACWRQVVWLTGWRWCGALEAGCVAHWMEVVWHAGGKLCGSLDGGGVARWRQVVWLTGWRWCGALEAGCVTHQKGGRARNWGVNSNAHAYTFSRGALRKQRSCCLHVLALLRRARIGAVVFVICSALRGLMPSYLRLDLPRAN
eukprot:366227-Chlamydomonas_euryale.AAC.4